MREEPETVLRASARASPDASRAVFRADRRFKKAAVCHPGRVVFFFSPTTRRCPASARHSERAADNRPVPSPQNINMADEGEVSALVCDNGSGMVKVRVRSPPTSWVCPALFLAPNVPVQTSGQQRRAPGAPARDPRPPTRAPRSSIVSRRPATPRARSPSRFHPSRAIASAPPRDHPKRAFDAPSAVVPTDPRGVARVSRVTSRPRSSELTEPPPAVVPSLPPRLVSPATTPPAPSSPPSWVAPATRA